MGVWTLRNGPYGLPRHKLVANGNGWRKGPFPLLIERLDVHTSRKEEPVLPSENGQGILQAIEDLTEEPGTEPN